MIHTFSYTCYLGLYDNQVILKKNSLFKPVRTKNNILIYHHSTGQGISYKYHKQYKYLTVIINPNRLLKQSDQLVFKNDNDKINKVLELYSDNFNSLFPNSEAEQYVNRIDYKLDVPVPDEKERELYIKLFKKSYKKYGYMKQVDRYNSSLKFKGKTVELNIYNKYQERIDRNEAPDNYKFIRLEVQLSRPKLKYNKKTYGVKDTIQNYYNSNQSFYS